MKQFSIYLVIILLFTSIGWIGNNAYRIYNEKIEVEKPIPTPLAKYTIENLSESYKTLKPSEITIGETIKETEKFTSKKFYFTVEGKKVSGLINIPSPSTIHNPPSAILMIRGYVDPKIYYTGLGTKNAAEYFVNNGFITIAPDFLGYAESDKEAEDIFESRFQTYTTILTLLKSIPNFSFSNLKLNSQILLWAHSNGGQIALTTLEITGENYPTVLWAPVTKPFPYSILYYTDDAEDRGKFLRSKLSQFENLYDVESYSMYNFIDKIKSPIQLHQGTADDAVPFKWSDDFVKKLKEKDIEIEYIKYSGADHNLSPKWNEVIENSLTFYDNQIK